MSSFFAASDLVALYWIHQYKTLLIIISYFQTPNQKTQIWVFMKPRAVWDKLKHRNELWFSNSGNLFTAGRCQKSLRPKTWSASATNIRDMPSKYIHAFPSSDARVFEVAAKDVRPERQVFLDLIRNAKRQWGEFSLPKSHMGGVSKSRIHASAMASRAAVSHHNPTIMTSKYSSAHTWNAFTHCAVLT